MEQKRIVITGGDMRQYYMAKSLIKRGFAIFYYGAVSGEKLAEMDAFVLPVLYKNTGRTGDKNKMLDDIVRYMQKESYVFGAGMSEQILERFSCKQAKIHDFINDDTCVALREELLAQEVIIAVLLVESFKSRAEIEAFFPGDFAAQLVGELMAESICSQLSK